MSFDSFESDSTSHYLPDDIFDSFSPSLQDYLPHCPITLGEARAVANILVTLPHIVAIEVYGSIARDSFGNDLDLVLVTDDEGLYQRFTKETIANLSTFGGKGPLARAAAAAHVLGKSDFETALKRFEIYTFEPQIAKLLDLFIMPVGWKARTDEIQRNLPHDNSSFVSDIAKDARVIATR